MFIQTHSPEWSWTSDWKISTVFTRKIPRKNSLDFLLKAWIISWLWPYKIHPACPSKHLETFISTALSLAALVDTNQVQYHDDCSSLFLFYLADITYSMWQILGKKRYTGSYSQFIQFGTTNILYITVVNKQWNQYCLTPKRCLFLYTWTSAYMCAYMHVHA